MAGSKTRKSNSKSRSKTTAARNAEYDDDSWMEGGAKKGCRGLACASATTRARVSKMGGKAKKAGSKSGSKTKRKTGSKTKKTASKTKKKAGSKTKRKTSSKSRK